MPVAFETRLGVVHATIEYSATSVDGVLFGVILIVDQPIDAFRRYASTFKDGLCIAT